MKQLNIDSPIRAIPFYQDNVIDVGLEGFVPGQMDSREAYKKYVMDKAPNPKAFVMEISEAKGPKLDTNKVGDTLSIYLYEHMFYWEEYINKVFLLLNSLQPGEKVNVYFWTYFPFDVVYVQDVVPIFNAINQSSANVTAKIYNNLSVISTWVAFGCRNIQLGNYGSVILNRPTECWGDFNSALLAVVDLMYDKFMERGLVKQEEYDSLVDDKTKNIYLYANDLRPRLAG